MESIANGAQDRAKLYHLAANTSAEIGDNEKAFDYHTRAIKESTARMPMLENLIDFARRHDMLDAAESTLRETRTRLIRQPQISDTYRALITTGLAAVSALENADSDVVLSLFEESLAIDPFSGTTWSWCYNYCESIEARERFQATFRREIEPAWNANLAVPASCEAVAHVWIQSPPNSAAALEILGNALVSIDPYRMQTKNAHLDWAASEVAQFVVGAPMQIQLNAAIILSRAGKFEEAVVLLDQIAADSSNVAFAVSLEKIYALLGADKAKEAEQSVRDAMLRSPGNLDLMLALPRVLVRQGRVEEARFEYDLLAASLAPGSPIMAAVQQDLQELPSSGSHEEMSS
jgi:tetratricopeptide (TPR) repeat protein